MILWLQLNFSLEKLGSKTLDALYGIAYSTAQKYNQICYDGIILGRSHDLQAQANANSLRDKSEGSR